MYSSLMQPYVNAPWKVWNELWRCLVYPAVRLTFLFNRLAWDKSWRLHGVPIIQKHRHSTMEFGCRMGLRSFVRSNPLGPVHPVILCTWRSGAVLNIGDDFAMTGGTICAAEKIIIGNRVAVGANSTIVDTDFHPLNAEKRWDYPQEANTAPIIIGNDVFIGMNCLILKGVTIGCGSVIGAGSVVTKSVPDGVIAAGNPARVIRSIKV